MRSWTIAIPALVAAAAATGVARAEADANGSLAPLIDTLRSPDADEARRLDAAARLLARLADTGVRAILQEALWDDRPAGIRRLVARAAASADADPAALARSLGTALSSALRAPVNEADALALLAALARCPTHDAVRAVIEHAVAPEGVPPDIRAAAFDALAAQSGQSRLGDDRSAWILWWEDAQWQRADEWRRRGMPGAPPTTAPEGQRLASLYRRLHAVIPDAERDRLLVEMLAAPEEPVRLAAFELIMVSLVNAKPVGDEAASASAARLSDPSTAVRIEAARTAELLDRPEALPALRAAIEHETDPSAAAAMLRAASLHAGPSDVESALRWLSAADETARAAAAEMLDAAANAAVLEAPARDRVRAALEALGDEGWPPAACRLAARMGLGDPLARLLAEEDRERARRCANALADVPAALDALVAAALEYPDLYEPAAVALARHAATAEGFVRLQALRAPTEKDRLDARAMMARALPPTDLQRIARREANDRARARFLAAVVSPEYLAVPTDLPERVELSLMLGEAQIRAGWSREAIATLDMLPTGWQGPRAVALRVTALLCLGRRGEAELLAPAPIPPEAPVLTEDLAADAWLSALEWCGGPDRETLREAIESRFGPTLSPEQALRLRSLGP